MNALIQKWVVLSVIGCFFLSLFFVYIMIQLCRKYRIFDIPNERSSHAVPTALMGGIGFILAFISITILTVKHTELLKSYHSITSIGFSIILLLIVSIVDDIYLLSTKFRIGMHAASGILLAIGIIPPEATIASIGLLLFCFISTVASINVVNFMDGLDGYAAGVTVIGLVGMLSAFYIKGHILEVQLIVMLISALIGFLVWNFPKASIFMGDVGSAFLGLIIAGFGVRLIQVTSYESIVLILLFFGVFILDAGVTLFRRIKQKAKLADAHREHFYQRLNQSGWSHRKVIFLDYSHSIINVILGLMYISMDHMIIKVALLALFCCGCYMKYSFISNQFEHKVAKSI